MGTVVIATLNICQFSNSVWVGNEKPQAMQWITPKQMPTPSIMSGHEIIPGTISPKPWHPVFATQVDILILSTCNKPNYHPQTAANCPPCQFPCLWDWLGLHLAWLRFSWFSEHLNRPIDVQRFVPPEDVYHEIHGHICKHHNFEMGDWEVFNATHNALHYEPWHLEENKELGKPVAFTPVLDFHLCWHGECVDIVMHKILYK